MLGNRNNEASPPGHSHWITCHCGRDHFPLLLLSIGEGFPPTPRSSSLDCALLPPSLFSSPTDIVTSCGVLRPKDRNNSSKFNFRSHFGMRTPYNDYARSRFVKKVGDSISFLESNGGGGETGQISANEMQSYFSNYFLFRDVA